MAKVLSMREQVDCLLIALETELEALDRECRELSEQLLTMQEGTALYSLTYGLHNAKMDAASRIRRIYDAGKKQRERWNA